MRINKLRKAAALVCTCAMLGVAACGCGSEAPMEEYRDKVVMTVGDQEVPFSEAYFLVKWQQANYQNIIAYNGSYGDDWYAQDIFGTGESFQDYFKDYYQELLTRICVARDKFEEYGMTISDDEKGVIDQYVNQFLGENSEDALNAMLADEDTVRQVLTDYRILERVAAKEVENVDQEVSQEELREAAYTRTYDYIYVSFETKDEEGKSTLLTAAEQEDYMNQLGIIRAQTIEKGDFDQAAKDAGQTVSSHTYHPGDDESKDTLHEINDYMDTLELGAVSDVIPLDDTGVILAYMASDNTSELEDEEVLSKAKDTVIAKRKLETFQNAVKEWRAEYKDKGIKVDEDLWGKITMEEPLAAVSSKSK